MTDIHAQPFIDQKLKELLAVSDTAIVKRFVLIEKSELARVRVRRDGGNDRTIFFNDEVSWAFDGEVSRDEALALVGYYIKQLENNNE